jgi:HSP20 family protein
VHHSDAPGIRRLTQLDCATRRERWRTGVARTVTPVSAPAYFAGTHIASVRSLMETTTETKLPGLWGKLRGRLDRPAPGVGGSSGPLVRGQDLAWLKNTRLAAIAELLRLDARRLVNTLSAASPTLFTTRAARKRWMPNFEIRESDSALTLIADVPGIDPESLDIALTGNQLVISGRREFVHPGNERVHVTERGDGHFTRSFKLPPHLDLANITSELRDGILSIIAPIKPDARMRKIHVDGTQRRS